MQTINADIKSGHLRPVYLIYGEEAYLKRTLKERLRRAAVGDDTMNYTCMEGKEIDVPALMDMARTLPFFAPRRMILVEDSGFFRKDSGELADFLPEIPETTCLVFVEEEVDRRNRLYKRVAKLGHAAECTRQTPRKLKDWALKGFSQAGKKITAATMDEFLRCTGDDMENIRQEIEKLIGYVGDREVITTADVHTITTPQIKDRIFDMIDAVAEKDQARALTLYYDLAALREAPIKILVLIGRQFSRLLQLKELQEQGASRNEIAGRFHWKTYTANRQLKQASRFSREELQECLALCVESDEAIKSGNLKDNLAVEMLILKLSAQAEEEQT